MMIRRIRRSGFTLIELLIVMVILSILAVIVTGTFLSSTRRGRDSRRKNDLRDIASALEQYNNDYGAYPSDGPTHTGFMQICGDSGNSQCAWGGQFKVITTTYMVFLPQDPVQTQTYYYYTPNGGKSFELYAHMENTQDEGDGVNQSGFSHPIGRQCGVNTTIPCTFVYSSSDLHITQ